MNRSVKTVCTAKKRFRKKSCVFRRNLVSNHIQGGPYSNDQRGTETFFGLSEDQLDNQKTKKWPSQKLSVLIYWENGSMKFAVNLS